MAAVATAAAVAAAAAAAAVVSLPFPSLGSFFLLDHLSRWSRGHETEEP